MSNIIVMQKIESPYKMINHSKNLYLLKIVIDHLSLLRRQFVYLFIVTQHDRLRILDDSLLLTAFSSSERDLQRASVKNID